LKKLMLTLASLGLMGCATAGRTSRVETVDGASVLCRQDQAASGSSHGGRLRVAVVDHLGSPAARASVTVRRLSSETVFAILTDDTGHLRIEHLLPGRYSVEVELRGFRSSRARTLPVRAGCITSVTVPLEPTSDPGAVLSSRANPSGIDAALLVAEGEEGVTDSLRAVLNVPPLPEPGSGLSPVS
jgi:hypothetical protein